MNRDQTLAFAGLAQLSDTFVSDPQNVFSVGQSVKARIVEVGPQSNPMVAHLLIFLLLLVGRPFTPSKISQRCLSDFQQRDKIFCFYVSSFRKYLLLHN